MGRFLLERPVLSGGTEGASVQRGRTLPEHMLPKSMEGKTDMITRVVRAMLMTPVLLTALGGCVYGSDIHFQPRDYDVCSKPCGCDARALGRGSAGDAHAKGDDVATHVAFARSSSSWSQTGFDRTSSANTRDDGANARRSENLRVTRIFCR